MCKYDSIFHYLQNSTLFKLNDFWNLSFDKVYLKDEW